MIPKENAVKIGMKIDETRIDGSLSRMREDLETFLRLGLSAAEIPVHGVDAIRNGRLDLRRTRDVTEILGQFPFSYSVHAPNTLNLMDRYDFFLHRDVLRASLQFCREIGAAVLVYHPGRFTAEEEMLALGRRALAADEAELLLAREAAALAQVADEFPDITIAMENARPYRHHSPYCYAESLDTLKKQVLIIDRANVAVNLDLGHLAMSASFYGFDPIVEVRSVAGLIRHTHVHDNFGGSVFCTEKIQTHQIPFGRGDSHMPVGWGSIPFAGILGAFAVDYEGLYIMELRSRYFDHIKESADSLARIVKKVLPVSEHEGAMS